MKRYDFYIGFEGEPEMKITHSDTGGNIHSVITMWIGYFDSIMKQIKPNVQGNWEGILLLYHLHTGWYEEPNWIVKPCDVELFLQQLQLINISQLNIDEQRVYDVLIIILRDSIRLNGRIEFSYK